MVQPLATFTSQINRRGFGGDVILTWTYPEAMPQAWQLYIFKKQGEEVTDETISGYFAGTIKDDKLADMGIYVFRDLPNRFTRITDLRVENGRTYLYRALIQDDDTQETSAARGASATPTINMAINVVDGKDIVARAMEKTIDAMLDAKGNKPSIHRDISVFKSHARRKQEMFYCVVSRAAGQILERYFNETIEELPEKTIKGEADIDTIQVQWFSIGDPDRRDKFTALLRIMRVVMRHFTMMLGNGQVRDARIIMGADGEGTHAQSGEVAHMGAMTVALQIEQQIQLANPYNAPLANIDTTYAGVY